MELTVAEARARLREHANPERAAHSARYFKTGPGEYAEGDIFLGVPVPDVRRLARRYRTASRPVVLELLRSAVHEERLLALLIMVEQFRRGDEVQRRQIFEDYVANRRWVNNWDLVDTSAPTILGAYLFGRDRTLLAELAGSAVVWDRRIAVLATQYFIRQGDFGTTLSLAEQLIGDPHDLIHKAVGWMLREIGDRDRGVLEGFLERHAHEMPRTMLRYAIEKLPAGERERWLAVGAGRRRRAGR